MAKKYSWLIKYFEAFSKMESYGKWMFPEEKYAPHLNYDKIVYDFIGEFMQFKEKFPEFSFLSWQKTLEKNQIPANFYKMKKLNVSLLNEETVVALITRVIRVERFSEGMMDSYFREGIIQKYLKRLVEIDNSRD